MLQNSIIIVVCSLTWKNCQINFMWNTFFVCHLWARKARRERRKRQPAVSENLFRRIFSRKVSFVYDKKGFSLFPISLFLPSRRRRWLLLGMMLLSWVRLYEIQQQRRVVQSLYALPLYLCLMSHQSKALCSFAGFDDIVGFSLLCACQATPNDEEKLQSEKTNLIRSLLHEARANIDESNDMLNSMLSWSSR